jgi:hypothetical protein
MTEGNVWQSQVDIGALTQRVTGLEASVNGIVDSIRALSEKLDSKPTNWWGLVAGMVGIFSLGGGAVTMLLSPINLSIERHEHGITHIAESAINREDYVRDRGETERWISSVRDRLRSDEDVAVSQRELGELEKRVDERYKITTEFITETVRRGHDSNKELIAELDKHIAAIDIQQVKRPEIEAANHSQDDRITTLSTRMNTIQAQIDSFFPPSKMIDELWSALREVRSGPLAAKP